MGRGRGCGVESENFKVGWSYGAGDGLLKGGAGTVPISIFQGLSFSHLEITLLFATVPYILR